MGKSKKEIGEFLQGLPKGKLLEICLQYMYDREHELKNLEYQIEKIKEIKEYIGEKSKLIKNLKNQLVEKDKEIEELKLKLDIRAMNLKTINTERMDAEQNKKQFAIQELEKVKDLVLKIGNNKSEIKMLQNGYSTLYVDSPEVISIIDNKIKELKG